jgi:tetratricopeptide (TPR) repeat protein
VNAMSWIATGSNFVFVKTDSLWQRVFVSLLIIALAAPALYRNFRVFRSDRIARSEQTWSSYNRALSYDLTNAELWWKRGRLSHYSIGEIDIPKAIQDYQTALQLNPRLGQAWLDLADAYERTGKSSEAEAALEKAFSTSRYSPLIRWQAGNFYLRRGNLGKMYECFKIACQYDPAKLDIAMQLAWKIDPDHAQILDRLVPDVLPANVTYLRFLADNDELDLAAPVWQRCLKNEIPPDYDLKPSSVFGYIDRLTRKNRVPEALRLWYEALQKGQKGFRTKSERQNLVWNGSFEDEIQQGGFDWRYPEIPEAKFQIDIGTRIEGLKSLRVTFESANISTTRLYQVVPVPEPGDYLLEFYVQTAGLTTDQLPYFLIQGFPDGSGASARTAPFPATATWSKISVPFSVKQGCQAVTLTLVRNRSEKFDNQIKGSLWLDNVTIRYQHASESGGMAKTQF